MHKTTDYLKENGFVDTRASSLSHALYTIHISVSALDRAHLNRLSVYFPQVIEAARAYAKIEGGLNRFDELNK